MQRESGRSFHVEGPKTEKAREPTVESLVQGIWRLRVLEAERRNRSPLLRRPSYQTSVFKTWSASG